MRPFSLKSFCISALGGGGGKTLLALGLARCFVEDGYLVKPFKKGPDYIDARWLSQAAKTPATNLDLFFLPPGELVNLFTSSLYAEQVNGEKVIALLEGNRGLYDGLDAQGSCSTAQLCRTLRIPAFLSIDCTKTTRTVAAILSGVLNFEKDLEIAGIILNRVASVRHEAILRASIEASLDVPIVGILPKLEKNPLPERHMGLASTAEVLLQKADKIIAGLAGIVRNNLDLRSILALARQEKVVQTGCSQQAALKITSLPAKYQSACPTAPLIGYVHDEALWFYYQENLLALQAAGARLVRLSLLDESGKDLKKWRKLDGLYLGGGFPEDYVEKIARSRTIREIAAYARQNLPIYAECGGLMVLGEGVSIKNRFYKMAGVLPLVTKMHSRPQALGYVEARVTTANPYFPYGAQIRGHEFHYSRCLLKDTSMTFALTLDKGSGICGDAKNSQNTRAPARDGIVRGNLWASYLHIFAPAAPMWAVNFVSVAKRKSVYPPMEAMGV